MKFIKNLVVLSLLGLISTAHAQQTSSADLTCRAQAKEIALQTYQSCVTTARQQRVDEIRKEYQAKLTDLKSHYDSELKKLAPGSSAVSAKSSSNAGLTGKNKKLNAEANSRASAQVLPKKKLQNVQSLPIQSGQSGVESTSVVEETDSPVNVVDPEVQSE
ncbi:MAG: hypothetical protein AABY64_12505 [Bdellovibrionota bacterium]